MRSAQKEADTHEMAKKNASLTVEGSEVEEQYFVRRDVRSVTDIDWNGYVHAITRMKPVPAFDHFELTSPENEEFGDECCEARHFTVYSAEHSTVGGEMADKKIIGLMSPVRFIREAGADIAHYWRIRHGAYDRDTSIAIPVILQLLLRKAGCDVDFFLPWGTPHRGDYDLEELFAWIDTICSEVVI